MSMKLVGAMCCGLALWGCGSGQGSVTVTAYGESFIEDGIPAEAMNDGWAVSFERFQVSLSDVLVAGVAVGVPDSIDVAQASDGAGHVLGSVSVPEGSYRDGAFTVERIEVEGIATRGDVTKTFGWVFDEATRYDACDTQTSVPDGGDATFQVTLHADHLFYDSLVAEGPQVLFQALADADADVDREVTRAELAATDIGAYDPGSDGGVEDLWAWLVAATRTVGHVDGEGHCDASPAASE